MRKALTFFTLITVAALLGGCIVTKTPITNDVTIPLGAQVTFSVVVLPSTATFAWTLDEEPLPNTGNSYVYTAQDGEHFLTVKATHILGTDTQTWHILTNTFNKIYGGIRNHEAFAMQQTSDGGYILAGRTYDITGRDYAWLIKTDANGDKVWDKTFLPPAFSGMNSEAYAVQQTSDGGYILAGWTTSLVSMWDAWLIKTDAHGNKVWDKAFGGGGIDYAYSVQQTSDGGYILAGYTYPYGGIYSDFLLIKTDANGNKVWDTTFGGSDSDYAYSVQQTSDGGYILAGVTHSFGEGSDAWLIKTDADGNKVWDTTFGGGGASAVQQTSDGGYILAGAHGGAWLVKTDADGNKVWDTTLGGGGASAVQQTSDGGYILAGGTGSYPNTDAWLIKTDANGNKVWDKTFGGSKRDLAYAVQQTSDGGYILAGWTNSFGEGFHYAWLIKTDAEGNAPATPTP